MFPKRKGSLVQCFKDGELVGVKTPREWAEELGIRTQSVYDSTFKGSLVRGQYMFYKVKEEPDEPKPVTLSEKNAEAKAQGKSYAELQMEETLAMLKTAACDSVEVPNGDETEEDMEITEETVKPAEIAQETKKDILLSDFAKLADETTIIVYQGEQWILTAPSDSPIFEPLKWFIDSFRAGMMDGTPIMKVTVWS